MLASADRRTIAKGPANAIEILGYERILADGLRDFLCELATIDGGTLVSYICSSQHANLGDVIGSSTELMIKPGRLFYGNDAAVEFDWGRMPSVAIAMELRDDRLTAFFRVVFGSEFVGVDIHGILFTDEIAGDREESLRCFRDAVADARLPDRRGRAAASGLGPPASRKFRRIDS
jgi:hypothetical protein